MSQFDHIPIETSEGHRPPSPAADRLLIGLAAAALLGGLLVAASNLLGPDDAVSQASGSPAPTDRPRRTPRPTPTPPPPRVLTLEPGTPEVPEQGSYYSGWIRAKADIVVHASALLDSRQIGIIEAGAAAYVDEQRETDTANDDFGWMFVSAPEPSGWIATTPDSETDLVQRYEWNRGRISGSIWTLAASPDGFLAIGSPAGPWDAGAGPVVAVSADGDHWQPDDSGIYSSWASHTPAWGPAGWLVATMIDTANGSQIWIYQSDDGQRWTPLGMLPGLPQDNYLAQLVGSEKGYVLTTFGSSPRRVQGAFAWFSADGETWSEGSDLGPQLSRSGWGQLLAAPIGFYAWQDVESGAAGEAFSSDGLTWTPVDGGPDGGGVQIVGVGNRLVATDLDPTDGAVRMWTAVEAGGALAWVQDAEAARQFEGGVVTTLASDGERVLAFGWDRETEAPLVWRSDRDGVFRSQRLPHDFGGMPRLAVGGPAGLVVVGYRHSLRGENPVIWRETASGLWVPESSPFLQFVGAPSPDDCGAPPADFLELSVMDRGLTVACFGDQTFTVDAWVGSCPDCVADQPQYRPPWLHGNGVGTQIFLSPIEADGWWTQAALDPSLTMNPDWIGEWVELNLHVDDPAAEACVWTPSPAELPYYDGRQADIDRCRQQLVVTSVRVLDEG